MTAGPYREGDVSDPKSPYYLRWYQRRANVLAWLLFGVLFMLGGVAWIVQITTRVRPEGSCADTVQFLTSNEQVRCRTGARLTYDPNPGSEPLIACRCSTNLLDAGRP